MQSISAPLPLRIAFLNLMPAKCMAEEQVRSILSEGDHPFQLTLLRVAHPEKDEAAHRDWRYAEENYQIATTARDCKFDGLIVNGAPLGQKRFEDVTFWPELTEIFNWASGNVGSTLNICWAAAASLKHFHNIERRLETHKFFGVYPQLVANAEDPLVSGIPSRIDMPVSRFSTVDHAQVRAHPGLDVILASPATGVGLVRDIVHNQILCFNHPEYGATSLATEFWRDRGRNLTTPFPVSTFPHDDIKRTPEMKWGAAREIISTNWLREVAEKASVASKVQERFRLLHTAKLGAL